MSGRKNKKRVFPSFKGEPPKKRSKGYRNKPRGNSSKPHEAPRKLVPEPQPEMNKQPPHHLETNEMPIPGELESSKKSMADNSFRSKAGSSPSPSKSSSEKLSGREVPEDDQHLLDKGPEDDHHSVEKSNEADQEVPKDDRPLDNCNVAEQVLGAFKGNPHPELEGVKNDDVQGVEAPKPTDVEVMIQKLMKQNDQRHEELLKKYEEEGMSRHKELLKKFEARHKELLKKLEEKGDKCEIEQRFVELKQRYDDLKKTNKETNKTAIAALEANLATEDERVRLLPYTDYGISPYMASCAMIEYGLKEATMKLRNLVVDHINEEKRDDLFGKNKAFWTGYIEDVLFERCFKWRLKATKVEGKAQTPPLPDKELLVEYWKARGYKGAIGPSCSFTRGGVIVKQLDDLMVETVKHLAGEWSCGESEVERLLGVYLTVDKVDRNEAVHLCCLADGKPRKGTHPAPRSSVEGEFRLKAARKQVRLKNLPLEDVVLHGLIVDDLLGNTETLRDFARLNLVAFTGLLQSYKRRLKEIVRAKGQSFTFRVASVLGSSGRAKVEADGSLFILRKKGSDWFQLL